MAMSFDLTGRVAAVTGANTGLGQAMAVALAEAGASVALIGRSPPDNTAEMIRALNGKYTILMSDLSQPESAAHIIKETESALGPLDILVNNAGIIRREDALEFSEDDWDDVIVTNLKTPFFLAQAAARSMVARNRPGKIINIASLLSLQGGVRVASYTASKSGLAGLTRLLANEWANKNINVNAIVPGYFATNNTEALRCDVDRSRQILERIPAGRWGEPEDLAGTVVFLASAASDYVHGALIPVDGGGWQGDTSPFHLTCSLLLTACSKRRGARPLFAADSQPADYPTTQGLYALDRFLQAATNGEMRIRVYPGGQLGAEKDTLELAVFGGIDLTRVNLGPLTSVAPLTSVLALPFLFNSIAHARRVFDGSIGRTVLDSLTEHGLRGLCFYDSGA